MISLFDKELQRVEQELRDLKTSHKRGAGTTRFYTAEQTITLSNYGFAKFQATVLEGEPSPAFISIYVNNHDNYTIDSDAGEDWRQVWFGPWDPGIFTYTVRAISTSKIKLEQIPV